MPTYRYVCPNCSHDYTVVRSMSTPDLNIHTCPVCSAQTSQRIGIPNIDTHFVGASGPDIKNRPKGGGFRGKTFAMPAKTI